MGKQFDLSEHVTLLVNSCDAYEDLWIPFFTLLKKYWNTESIQIILNTETKDFSFEGLEITCVHPPTETQYGARMLHALSQVKTKYVLPLLDDFFLRQPVNCERISEIIHWMEEDPDIVYFNCDRNGVYANWEVNKYPGFRRYPPGNGYILSMQAAIWRTEQLMKYWRPNVSPWEWELLCNISTKKYPRDKFYTTLPEEDMFLDYGYDPAGMGVFRGKWVQHDVVPLFEKEGIHVDYSRRGFYDPAVSILTLPYKSDRKSRYSQIIRIFGLAEIPRYFLFGLRCRLCRLLRKSYTDDYFSYLTEKEHQRFYRKLSK